MKKTVFLSVTPILSFWRNTEPQMDTESTIFEKMGSMQFYLPEAGTRLHLLMYKEMESSKKIDQLARQYLFDLLVF